jgi:alpha-tubulin suppressor-like RCC1 family protein
MRGGQQALAGMGGPVNNHKKLMVGLCLHVLQHINKLFLKFVLCMQMVLLPQWTKYDRRVFFIFVLQWLSCDFMALTLMKTLQFYYKNTNFLLVLSLGSLLPFARAVYSLWTFIPCPNMAAVISNVSLVFTFVLLLVLGLGTYESSAWIIYAFIMSAWPWLILCSMISRLFIDRNLNKNPFSPVKDFPFLGILGAGAQVLMLMALKHISVSDAIVLSFLDPVWSATLATLMMGKARLKLHARQVKLYVLIIFCCLVYLWGDVGPGELLITAPSMNHAYFVVARVLLALRSIYVKRSYAIFNHAKIPDAPPEDGMLFYNTKDPRMHRFKMFPSPILHILDAIFDSGLRDMDFHGMGPLGTEDLFMLTEFSYVLPISTMMAWMYEFSELKYGFLPPSLYEEVGSTAQSAMSSSAANVAVTIVAEKVNTSEVAGVIMVVLGFCMCRFLTPVGTAKSLFDRASSSHSWKYHPLMIAGPFFAFDALFLNPNISKMQIIIAGCGAATVAYYRQILWNLFKRKHYLLSTQMVQYNHPSILRTLQKRTLLEFAHSTSIDDYSVLLLETVIANGNNIREIARDMRITVWDPTPTATAAWKLAFSLVTKSLKKQRQVRTLKKQEKESVMKFVKDLIFELADKAVDLAEGHGGRLVLATSLAGVVAKRCAIRKLHRAALRKRTLRHRRKMGQLATVPMTLSVAGGTFRTVREMTTLDSSGKLPTMTSQIPALPAPPTAAGGVAAQTQMSLTASASPDMLMISSGSNGAASSSASPPQTLPNAITQNDSGNEGSDEDDEDSPISRKAAEERLRGLWYQKSMDINDEGGTPVGAVVLSCGDVKCGQIGLSQADVAKSGHASVHVVEELRGTMPAQVVAAGVASFVVTAEGKVYAFGSNRAMELGMRKDVTQVTNPQLLKSMRSVRIVQVESSPSASGQAHTVALTSDGEVYTFGTSSRGALGQGDQVKQTAPLLMRFTQEVRIRMVAAGARHTLMVADTGKLYSFGDNGCGQLGTDMVDDKKRPLKFADTPVAVGGPLFEVPILRLAVGDDHNLAVTEENLVFSWGANSNGQLGLGRSDDQHRPVRVRELEHQGVAEVSSVACGSRHSLVVSAKGVQPGSSRLFAFGSNVEGQLGIGQTNASDGHIRPSPQLVRTLSDVRDIRIVQVVAAASHSLALTQVGEVYSFGDNAWGQLGFPPEGGTDYNSAHAARRPAPAAFGATSTAFAMTAQIKGRKASEIDAPLAFANGVARLWIPTRILGLSLYKIKGIATADTHSLALAA